MTHSDSRPSVTVIIPLYNAQSYVAETIESVLNQDWRPLEIVVVDDGSTDDSVSVVKRFGSQLRLLEEAHRGLAAARNRGLQAVTGQFVLHLDADDLLLPDSITTLMRHFEGCDDLDIVTGRLQCFLSPELPEEARRRYRVPAQPQKGHISGASVIRADAFRKYGPLDESFIVNADLEWWVRATNVGARVHPIEDTVLHRRIHGRNISLMQKAEMTSSRLRIVRASMERRGLIAGRRPDRDAN